jgi:putative RNA 2'-phosphotransferase
MKNLEKLSKFLALVLRHEPEQFGITLDEQGFTDTDALWKVVQQKFGVNRYEWGDLLAVVDGDQDAKKRYEIQGRRIRAMYGHNRAIQIEYPPAIPPEILYHGTTAKSLAAIRQEGLKSLGRQYAWRRTHDIVLLKIHAGEAQEAGYVFYHPEAEHYLVKELPPDFIDFP